MAAVKPEIEQKKKSKKRKRAEFEADDLDTGDVKQSIIEEFG